MPEPLTCPVCAEAARDADALAGHLVTRAAASDGPHVMWLNRRVSRQRMPAEELAALLPEVLSGGTPGGDRVRR